MLKRKRRHLPVDSSREDNRYGVFVLLALGIIGVAITAYGKHQIVFSLPQRQTKALRTEQMIGSWIGNTWIPPPPWKLFSVTEMQSLYEGRNILWLGDSTARRAAMMLYAIRNSTTYPHVSYDILERDLDVNRDNTTEVCHKWDNLPVDVNETSYPEISRSICRRTIPQPGEVTHIWAKCIRDVRSLLEEDLRNNLAVLGDYDLVVIALGIWHQLKPHVCKSEANETIADIMEDVMNILQEEMLPARPHLRIICRTSGWSAAVPVQDEVVEFNEALKRNVERKMDPHLSYVNWGEAVAPRSFRKERIQGDVPPHYGQEPRLVLLQMVTNQLVSMNEGAWW